MNAGHLTRHDQCRNRDMSSSRSMHIPLDGVTLERDLVLPKEAKGLVLFAHGGGSSRHSPRNQFVVRVLRQSGSATFLFDLLTRADEVEDASTGLPRCNIGLLAEPLAGATGWTEVRK